MLVIVGVADGLASSGSLNSESPLFLCLEIDLGIFGELWGLLYSVYQLPAIPQDIAGEQEARSCLTRPLGFFIAILFRSHHSLLKSNFIDHKSDSYISKSSRELGRWGLPMTLWKEHGLNQVSWGNLYQVLPDCWCLEETPTTGVLMWILPFFKKYWQVEFKSKVFCLFF